MIDFVDNLLSTQAFDNTLLEEGVNRRDVFRTPNDVSNPSSSSLELHGNELANNSYALSPSSSNTSTMNPSSSNNILNNSIYTTGSSASDNLNLNASGGSALLNGAYVNGHQVDPADLQAFESFHQGRLSHDDQMFVVIYLIDTFRYELTTSVNDENTSDNEQIDLDERMDSYIKKAMFRAYMDLIKDIPEKTSIRINIQVTKYYPIHTQICTYF